MRKVFLTGFIAVLIFGNTALADVLPPGQRAVDVCAYFTNTASVLDTMAVYGYETSVTGGLKSPLSSFIADECFGPSYKFNTYKVYGVTADHAKTVTADTYNPSTDPEAYPTNIELSFGTKYVSEGSTVEKIKNAYKIIKLDTVNKQLIIEPVQSEEYYIGSETPTILPLGGTVTTQETTGEKVFTDVDSNSPYFAALQYLKGQNVIAGYADGSFKPGNTINRAEFTKIVVGAALAPTADDLMNCESNFASQTGYMLTVFKDVEFAMVGGNIPPWYLDYVCLAKVNKFVSGYPDGSFRPEQNINFVEAAKIIALAMNFKSDNTDPWYKTYVDTLSTKKAIPMTIRSFNQNITRGEMADMMYRLKAKIETLDSASYADIAY